MNSIISGLTRRSCRAASVVLVVASFSVLGATSRTNAGELRTQLFDSVKPVVSGGSALDASDLDQRIAFMVPLRMRSYQELLARIARGEIIQTEEMFANYYPSRSDYKSVVDWLARQNFTITKTDPNRLGIFASATVGQLREALQVEFGRVTVGNRAFVSAVTVPSVPISIAPLIWGINGLQPHIQLRKHSHIHPVEASPLSPRTANQPPFLINEILKAYNANGLSVTGAGQKIAIVIDTFPASADLTSFWATNAVSQSINNIEFVQVVAGGLPPPSGEETLDAEWASGIASGAKVRVYASTDLSFVNIDQVFQAIINDLPTQPEMHEVSISLGAGENDVGASQLQTDAQYLATMAANGLSVFVSSGDSGSLIGGITQVSYFASDPNVTGVGGTSLFLNSTTGNTENETVWNDFEGATGGGISGFFARPSWQVGGTVPAGNTRLVPDISSAGDPETGGLIILNGLQYQVGGTSWSAPVWAGFCALINQARSNSVLPPAGLLGPRIYPFLGTSAFRDITSGNNGNYTAGVGYDLCTGIGVPNIATLLPALSGGPTPTPTPTPVPTPTPAPYGVIFSPSPNSVLPSTHASPQPNPPNVTFQWTAGSVSTAYWLIVGNGPGRSDIFSSSQTGGLFCKVTNIPEDGRTVYVRLWSRVGGTWYTPPQDYVYTSYRGIVLTPVITPASGTFRKKVKVTIVCGTPGATIRYTTDGTIPTTTSPQYTSPFTLTGRRTVSVRAKAFKDLVPDSAMVTTTYTIR